jgi:hypothetical protein
VPGDASRRRAVLNRHPAVDVAVTADYVQERGGPPLRVSMITTTRTSDRTGNGRTRSPGQRSLQLRLAWRSAASSNDCPSSPATRLPVAGRPVALLRAHKSSGLGYHSREVLDGPLQRRCRHDGPR